MNLLILITMLIGCGNEDKKKLLKINESIKLITQLINSGADIDKTNEEGMTQLMLAAQEGNVEGVKLLIKARADVNKENKNGITALIFAIIAENIEIINELIEAFYDIKYISNGIHVSIDIQNLEITKILVKAILEKKYINESEFSFHPRWDWAMDTGNVEIFLMIKELTKVISDLDGNVNQADEDEKMCMMACCLNQIEILKILIKDKPHLLNVALIMASINGNLEVIKALIADGANVNKKDEDKNNALFYAITEYDVEIINELIAAGAIIKNIEFDKIRKMLNESSKEDKELMEKFIAAVKNKDTVLMCKLRSERNKNKTLISALQCHNTSTLRALIASGADVNVADEQGQTPLMYATKRSIYLNIINKLITAGANVNMIDKQGKTALMYAIERNRYINIIDKLIASGANVNMADAQGKTPLMYAILETRIDIIKSLLKAGADPNVTDKNGNTASSLAKSIDNSTTENSIFKELIKDLF